MSNAPERIWILPTEHSSDPNPDRVGTAKRRKVFALDVEYRRADLAWLPEELVERLRKADDSLVNLQPKIANGLFRPEWIPVIDDYIDPAIAAIRAVLAAVSQRGRGE